MPDTETYRMMLYDNDDKIIYDRLLTFSELRRIAPEVAARAEDVGDNGFPIAGEQPVAKCINCGFGRSAHDETGRCIDRDARFELAGEGLARHPW